MRAHRPCPRLRSGALNGRSSFSIRAAADASVIAVLVPIVDPSNEGNFIPPPYLGSKSASGPALVPSVVFKQTDPKVKKALHWALLEGYTINIDVQCDIRATEGGWDALEDLLASLEDPTTPKKHNANIIVCAYESSRGASPVLTSF